MLCVVLEILELFLCGLDYIFSEYVDSFVNDVVEFYVLREIVKVFK